MIDIAEALWRQAEPHVFISRKQFVDGLTGWEIHAHEIDGVIAAATLVRGPEFHFVSFGTGRRISSSRISGCLKPIIDKFGFVITRTPKDDARQVRFNLLIGFRVVAEDEFFTHFRMDELKMHKVKTCQS